MIIRNKLFKFSSLCIIGSITIIVNQVLPSNAGAKSYNDYKQESNASGIETSDKIIGGESVVSSSSKTEVTLASETEVPKEATPTATVTVAPTKDPYAIPGIDYNKYIDMTKYKNLGIANVTGYLNVRAGAGTDQKIIAKMPPNAGCTILSTSTIGKETWCKIKSGDITGYVMKDYLITGQMAQDMIKKVGHLVIIVDCNKLNIREKASKSSDVLYQVEEGEALKIVSVTAEWIEVELDIGEDTGFVASEYVNISFELEKAIDVDETLTGCTQLRVDIVNYAKKFLGNPYVYGGTSLTNGIDCSAYVRAIYAEFGYSLSRTSRDQASGKGTTISASELQPGDLVFYASSSGYIRHVAMYIGNKKIIHASNPSDGIKISNMYYTSPYKYKRILPVGK